MLLQVTDSGLAYMIIGGFAVALYVSEVVLGTAFGIIFGPYCADLFSPRSWGGDLNAVTLEIMRITLAAGLFTIGVELPEAYLAEHVKGMLVMVVPTMAFGWIIVAAVVYFLFPPLNFISSLLVAACLTPTDPIISAAIVGGKFATKHVPLNLRRIIAAESAANDGLAYPFLSLSVFLTISASTGEAFKNWFLIGCLYQVVLGTIIGAAIGFGFSKVMKVSHRKGFIDRESYVTQYLALTLFTIGAQHSIGTEGEVFASVIDLVLNCGTFVYIGAWIPFNMFNAPELGITPWRLVILFIAVLLLRRIPPLLMLYKFVPEIATWREALFAGHFGPMGVGAIFISTFAVTELPRPQSPPQGQAELLAATIQTIVAFVVLCSIIIHGLSIPCYSFGSRTLVLTRTLTARSRNSNPPDWLLRVRRPSMDVREREREGSLTTTEKDVEQGPIPAPVPPGELQLPEPIVVQPCARKSEQTQRAPEMALAKTTQAVLSPVQFPMALWKADGGASRHVVDTDKAAVTKDRVPGVQLRGVPNRNAASPPGSPRRRSVSIFRIRASSLPSIPNGSDDLSARGSPLTPRLPSPTSPEQKGLPDGVDEDLHMVLTILRHRGSSPSLGTTRYYEEEEVDVGDSFSGEGCEGKARRADSLRTSSRSHPENEMRRGVQDVCLLVDR
ncbi:Sodium/hydrogen exchanger family-domain-containing protein [Earliella scabrosa]|nr:Sodium/hydrogen exchanger family-domain-containing protein [Earliella scabrosa]